MVEIKVTTPKLVYKFREDGTKEDLTTYFQEVLKRKEDYTDIDDKENIIVPYNVLKNSTIEIYNIKKDE